jgi:threonine dehydrogenase-like Zn-dependent dehydrogenase
VTTGDSIHTALIPDVVHFAIPGGSPLKNNFHEGDTSTKALIYGEMKKLHGSSAIDIDVVIDCAGAPNVPGDFLNYAKQGAKLSCIALQKKEVPINFMQIMSTECKIMGSRECTTDEIL